MESNYCMLCHWYCDDLLCDTHKKFFLWDKNIEGFRLKKRKTNPEKFHIWKSETKVAKIIEKFYGKDNVVRGYHPFWAKSTNDVLLEYDIFIKNKNILIEYNGIQHYKVNKFFHIGRKSLKKRKEIDELKKDLAKKNGYKLIIFKYDEPSFKDYVIKKIEDTIHDKN